MAENVTVWSRRQLRDFLSGWSIKKIRDYLLNFDYEALELDSDIPELVCHLKIGWRHHSVDRGDGSTCYDFIKNVVGLASKKKLIAMFVRLVGYAKSTGSELFDIEFGAELTDEGRR